jgi:hypothetical protein
MHVVYPIELRVIYNFEVTGMFCVCVCVCVNDFPSSLVNVRDTRTPSKKQYHILSVLHVSAVIGNQRAYGTTK